MECVQILAFHLPHFKEDLLIRFDKVKDAGNEYLVYIVADIALRIPKEKTRGIRVVTDDYRTEYFYLKYEEV